MFFKISRGEVVEFSQFATGGGGSFTVLETFEFEGKEFTTTNFIKTFDETLFNTVADAVEDESATKFFTIEGKVQYSRTTSQKAVTETGEAFEYHSTNFTATSIKPARNKVKRAAVKSANKTLAELKEALPADSAIFNPKKHARIFKKK